MIICRTCDPKSKHSGSSLYRDELNPAEIRTRSSESHEFPTLGLAARVHAALIVASTTRRNAATKPAPGTKPALELPAHGGRARAGRQAGDADRQAGRKTDGNNWGPEEPATAPAWPRSASGGQLPGWLPPPVGQPARWLRHRLAGQRTASPALRKVPKTCNLGSSWSAWKTSLRGQISFSQNSFRWHAGPIEQTSCASIVSYDGRKPLWPCFGHVQHWVVCSTNKACDGSSVHSILISTDNGIEYGCSE